MSNQNIDVLSKKVIDISGLERFLLNVKNYIGYEISNKANTSGYYEDLEVGLADNLIGRDIATDREFVFSPSGGEGKSIQDGTARITNIYGSSLVWNQLVNNIVSNDLGTTGWYVRQGNDKAVISGNKITITFTSGVSDFPVLGQKLNLKSNRKYYIKITYEVPKLDQYNRSLQVSLDSVYSASGDYEVIDALNGYNNTKQTVSTICNGLDEKPYLIIRPRNYTNDVGETMSCEVEVTDLTKMFGFGNEPTNVEEFESLYGNMPSDYNEGTIINNNTTAIKTTGFNAWDGQLELGMYNEKGKVETGNYNRCKNPIRVVGGAKYYFSSQMNGVNFQAYYYDTNMNYIGDAYWTRNYEYTIPTNAYYMGFYCGSFQIFIPEDNDICINLSHTGYRNGEYKPYESFTRQLPTVEGGLKSAGSVFDEIKYNQTTRKWEHIQRVGSVDLGTLEWSKHNTNINDIKRFITKTLVKDMADGRNFISIKYRGGSSYYGHDKVVECANYQIHICDHDYTDADTTTFKEAMQGVILYYELAEPIITELDFDRGDIEYNVWDFGTEEAIQEVPSTLFKSSIKYGFNAVDTIRWNEIEIENLKDKIKNIDINSGSASTLIKVSYNELVSLRNNDNLIPGCLYRITDYITTTSQENTMSAGHQFDVIVLATSENTLSEEARAIQHEGDTYFENSNLDSWKIWYSLDNDTERFAWTDSENGKGVIYRMIDEFNNECPYDFKNIQFNRSVTSEGVLSEGLDYSKTTIKSELLESDGETFKTQIDTIHNVVMDNDSDFYTPADENRKFLITRMSREYDPVLNTENLAVFAIDYHEDDDINELEEDYSDYLCYRGRTTIEGKEYDLWQEIATDSNSGGITYEPYNVYVTTDVITNVQETPKKYLYTFSWIDLDGEFGEVNSIYDFSIKGNNGDLLTDEDVIDGCYNNVIKPYVDYYGSIENLKYILNNSVFLSNCPRYEQNGTYNNILDINCYSNSFGNYCHHNSLSAECKNNSFGDSCYANSFGNYCYKNIFGSGCSSNSFGNYCYKNTFGSGCNYNSFGEYCNDNSFGNECYANSFGNDCLNNLFYSECSSNSFGNECCDNSFGNDCYFNSFDNNCLNNSFGNECLNNSFGNGCYFNSFGNECLNNSFGNECLNNSFNESCYANSFGNECLNNSFGNDCYSNSFGNNCLNNSFNESCNSNSFGNECYSNSFAFGCDYNSFGNECYHNSFSGTCNYNLFGVGCNYNLFGDGCKYNSFGEYCKSNSFSVYCYNNSLGNGCNSNTFGKYCENNSLGDCSCTNSFDNDCYYNSLGNGCYSNSFGVECIGNSFGNCCEDNSLDNGCYSNSFSDSCYDNSFDYDCCYNLFGAGCKYNSFGESCYHNSFGNGCNSNSFGNECCYNSLGNGCSSDSFGNTCLNNSFGEGCYDNEFGNDCNYNSFGNSCYTNSFGFECISNSFGNDCENNSFNNRCYNNSFGNDCNNNSFSDEFENNSFGDECDNNSFGMGCSDNSFGVACINNTFGDTCYNNSLGNHCNYNTFDNSFAHNSFGNTCSDNSFGVACINNTFGNHCSSNSFDYAFRNNTFSNDCNNNSFRMGSSSDSEVRSHCMNNIIENGVSYVNLYNTSTASISYQLRNVTVCQGMSGTSDSYNNVEIPMLNASYQIKVAKNTSGDIKVYCEADLIN